MTLDVPGEAAEADESGTAFLRRHGSPLILFETHVYTQLRRHLANTGRRIPVYFFRDHSGIEIDFVLAEGEKLRLIEVKWSELPAIPHAPFEAVSRAAGEAASDPAAWLPPSEDSECARRR